jgi:hypothetical protein
VGEYNATTGSTINASFISNGQGLGGPFGILLDSNNHLLVANATINTVGEYDATTGANINPTFVNGQGLNNPNGLVLDGNNHLFVANSGNNTVGEYDATTGATINASFINNQQGLNGPRWMALDATLHHLFVADAGNGTVGEYDAVTGATISAAFIMGFPIVGGLTLDGSNHLFVASFLISGGNLISNNVGEYDATTGAAINATFINNGQGLSAPAGLLFVPIPEPSSLMLVAGAAVSGVVMWRRRRECTSKTEMASVEA